MFQNLNSYEFLKKQEQLYVQILKKISDKHLDCTRNLNNADSELQLPLLRTQHMLVEKFKNVKFSLMNTRTLMICKMFADSDYGIVINRRPNQVYKMITKADKKSAVINYLFDYLNAGLDQDVEKFYRPMTAREVVRFQSWESDVSRIKKDKILTAAKLEMSESMASYRVFSKWENTSSRLSAITKKFLWLYSPSSPVIKLKSVFGTDNQNRNYRTWKGVNFIEQHSNRGHNFPKSWIMGSNGIVYPFAYAQEKNIRVAIQVEDSFACVDSGHINDLTLSFSRCNGWYDSDKYMTYQGQIADRDNFVTAYNGDRIYKKYAVFITRHQAWYPKDSCLETSEGVYELSRECINLGNLGTVHNSDVRVSTCGLCGNMGLTSDFIIMDTADTNSPTICPNCSHNLSNNIQRMCYSTDVIDHKGFGTTNMKIQNEPVYVGLELETYADYNDECKSKVIFGLNKFAASKQNYTVATRDGSLCGTHGIEYIFRPEGLVHQKRNVHHFIEQVGGLLAKDAGNGYGLHIHVSSHFLTNMDKVRIDNFVSIFEKYFRHVGARSETEYQAKKKISSNKNLKTMCDQKYKMVNIGRSGTIEYRFPKSLVDEVHINMNLEMALATTMFCKYHLSNVKLNINSLTSQPLKDFIDYVSANKKLYPLLNAENNANIKLNKLDSYSKFIKKSKRTVDAFESAGDESYSLSA